MIPVVQRDVRELPVALVDDPELAMRDTFDDAKFVELVESIKTHGVQIPLIVARRGDRYRVVAGHRRITACRHIGATTVPCDVRELDDSQIEALKILENDDREKVNPADAALYLQRLFVEKCGNDVDVLCAYVKRSRKYVDDRLRLLTGDPEIFDALRARKIGKGVALELNAIHDIGYRRLRLDNAIKFGMTEDAARDHRRQDNRAVDMGAQQAGAVSLLTDVMTQPAEARDVCHVCRRADHPERMRWIRVHEHCDLAHLEPMLAPLRAHYASLTEATDGQSS